MGVSISTRDDGRIILQQKNLSRILPGSQESNPRSVVSDLESGVLLHEVGAFFPWMDSDLYSEFVEHQRNLTTVKVSLPFVVVLYVILIGTRVNLYRFAASGPLFFSIGILCVIGTLVLLIIFSAQCIMYKRNQGVELEKRLSEYADWALKKLFFGHFEDVQCLFATTGCCVILLARVYAGQCPDENSIWASQGCNPVAQSHSIPHDQVIFNYMIPLLMSAIFKGCSIHAAILSYLISMSAIVMALAHVNGWLQIYSILYGFLFIYLSVDSERKDRLAFLLSKREIDAVKAVSEKEKEKRVAEEERRLIEEKTRQAESEKQLIQSMLGNMAHDMKTPIHCIKAELDHLRSTIKGMSGKLQPVEVVKAVGVDATHTITSIENITDFMLMSINRCQDYCKIDRGIALNPALGTFDVLEVFAAATRLMTTQSSDRVIAFQPLESAICRYIISDRHWLLENLLCLISNAVKYSPRGAQIDVKASLIQQEMEKRQSEAHQGLKSVVRASSVLAASANRPRSRAILFEVDDNGVGISDEMQRNLFQPFQQAQRMAGGTGLGLFSLRQRVEALGGKYGVRPRTDGKQGSVFWFTVPYRPDPTHVDGIAGEKWEHAVANGLKLRGSSKVRDKNKKEGGDDDEHTSVGNTPACASVADPKHGAVDKATGKARRVLVVDDTQTILKVTCRALQSAGYVVEAAENGSEALDKLKATSGTADAFDLCITDLQMPLMDGLECVRRYREFESTQLANVTPNKETSVKSDGDDQDKRLMIIGMSANSNDSLLQEVLGVGMDAFMEKPFKVDELERVLASIKTTRLIAKSNLRNPVPIDFSVSVHQPGGGSGSVKSVPVGPASRLQSFKFISAKRMGSQEGKRQVPQK